MYEHQDILLWKLNNAFLTSVFWNMWIRELEKATSPNFWYSFYICKNTCMSIQILFLGKLINLFLINSVFWKNMNRRIQEFKKQLLQISDTVYISANKVFKNPDTLLENIYVFSIKVSFGKIWIGGFKNSENNFFKFRYTQYMQE